jgi:hypothetical protein
MFRAAFYLIPYALIAAVSPLAFAATLTVIASGRLKALGFGIGFVAGQILICSVLVFIGSATIPHRQSNYPTVQAVIEVGLGLALLWLALRVRRHGPVATQSSGSRSQKVLDRLGRLHVFTALLAGLLLGIGGPKRLVLTALACASITESGTPTSEEAVLIGWYTVIATSLVWGPVLVFMLFGKRAVDELDAARRWVAKHQRAATFYPLVFVGVMLVLAGAYGLVD